MDETLYVIRVLQPQEGGGVEGTLVLLTDVSWILRRSFLYL